MTNVRTIMIIDDDRDLAMLVSDLLEDNAYRTVLASSIEEAYQLLVKLKPDLILLDINLPDGCGYELCEELRRVSQVPVIFVSARTSEDDKVVGLDIGGDDYLAKPFSLKELLSRVNSLLRRTYGSTKPASGEMIKVGDNVQIEIDRVGHIVTKNKETVTLSPKEYDLLVYFIDHMDEALSKEHLINEVWGMFSEVEPATLAVHVRWLREKLEEDPSNPQFIKTVWGIGYRCVVWKKD
ncbi:MAG: response regulator transcription factor [Eubacteriales bacterium]|nr:response regulator transcription factor [Lachnospiraceae bacterium]MDO5128203.1 response regulator transcription factor [Eubacteriales bacterium]